MFGRGALYCMCARGADMAWLSVTHCIVCLNNPNPLAGWTGVHLWLRGVVVLVPTNWCVGIHLWLRSVVAWVPTRG